jgi:tetratricopeptide (TPR) repeat protein
MPYVNLAYSYLNVDSVDKSIAVCEWMIGNNKGGEQFLYCAALGYSKKKNYVRSNELLDDCIGMNIQKEALLYLNLKSDNYEEMKLYKQAVNYHDTAYYIFHSPFDLYYAGRLYDKYLKNKAKAGFYYKQFMEKRKSSRNEGEERIVDYIPETCTALAFLVDQ